MENIISILLYSSAGILLGCFAILSTIILFSKRAFSIVQVLNSSTTIVILFLGIYLVTIDRLDFIDLAMIYIVLSYSSILIINLLFRLITSRYNKHNEE